MQGKVARQEVNALKAIPLGGQGEIGKNCWAFEYKDEIIIVNFGMMLPAYGLTGVDLILPNTKYLKENEDKIKGLVVTSAHDHCAGGVFYLLEKINIPEIYGSKLALEVIKNELPENLKLPKTTPIAAREEFSLGNFNLKPMSTTACLPDTFGLYIKSEAGNICYTGPYKMDQTPIDKTLTDYFSFSQTGEDGVDLLISDSTDIEVPGFTQSEKLISGKFNEIFRDTESRIVIVSSSCEIHKYQILLDLANKNKRKVALCGKDLTTKINSAVDSGFLKLPKDILVSKEEAEALKDKEVVFIASGVHGNFLTALIEMGNETHEVKLKPKDTIVISGNPIPGTTRVLAHTIDQLFVQKVQVVGGRGQRVHVSGHAAQEDAKFILSVTKPRSFVPSFGEERQLVLHGSIAEDMGINHNDVHIVRNGDVVEMRDGVSRIANKVPAGSIFYNKAIGLDIEESTMKERQALSKEGTITIALTFDDQRNIVAGPEIFAEACSFASGKDWRAFCLGTNEIIKQSVQSAVDDDVTDINDLKNIVKEVVVKSVLELIGKRPLINVAIQEVMKA